MSGIPSRTWEASRSRLRPEPRPRLSRRGNRNSRTEPGQSSARCFPHRGRERLFPFLRANAEPRAYLTKTESLFDPNWLGNVIETGHWSRRPAWMTRPCSNDLRERVVQAHLAGEPIRSVAARYHVPGIQMGRALARDGGMAPDKDPVPATRSRPHRTGFRKNQALDARCSETDLRRHLQSPRTAHRHHPTRRMPQRHPKRRIRFRPERICAKGCLQW